MSTGYVYIVAWPHGPDWIVKLGYTRTPKRWQNFARHGAGIFQCVAFESRTDALSVEQEMHRVLRAWPRAFRTSEEAAGHLGTHGGWTECYIMATPRTAAIALCGLMRYRGWDQPWPKTTWAQPCAA